VRARWYLRPAKFATGPVANGDDERVCVSDDIDEIRPDRLLGRRVPEGRKPTCEGFAQPVDLVDQAGHHTDPRSLFVAKRSRRVGGSGSSSKTQTTTVLISIWRSSRACRRASSATTTQRGGWRPRARNAGGLHTRDTRTSGPDIRSIVARAVAPQMGGHGRIPVQAHRALDADRSLIHRIDENERGARNGRVSFAELLASPSSHENRDGGVQTACRAARRTGGRKAGGQPFSTSRQAPPPQQGGVRGGRTPRPPTRWRRLGKLKQSASSRGRGSSRRPVR